MGAGSAWAAKTFSGLVSHNAVEIKFRVWVLDSNDGIGDNGWG